MGSAQVSELFELEQWLGANHAGAERLLPDLLDLPAPQLGHEIERHPELRLGIIRLLLDVAEQACERLPARAHELTSVVIEHAGVHVPPPRAAIARNLQAQAWSAHANALHCIGRYAEARHAIGVALDIYRQGLVSAWHIATAEVIEAQILHAQGERAEALHRIRRAAGDFLLHGDRDRYVQARMAEAWMHWIAGDRIAQTAVWLSAAEMAAERRDVVLIGFLENRIGLFELSHGSADDSVRHFEAAHEAFDAAGMTREAIDARRNLAEAATARRRFHEAISEYYKVQAMLLAEGAAAVVDCAVVSADILELLLLMRRDDQILPLVELVIRKFGGAGLKPGAMQAWTFVRERASACELTVEDVAEVRRYFEDLPLRPNARFLAPVPVS